MKLMPRFLAGIILMAAALAAQTAEPTIYAESFRKGATHVTEDSFTVKLTPANSDYRERIKDSAGRDRYELKITPQGPVGDTKITTWRVQLKDLRYLIYSNVLLASPEPSADAKNNLWWLNPDRFGPVPVKAKRIVKVDSFYVVIQVTDLHFTPLDSPYLDSMVVQFAFTNRDPRSAQ